MLTKAGIDSEIAETLKHGDNRQDITYLASLYLVRDHIEQSASVSNMIKTDCKSEFMTCVNGKCYEDILPAIDELMDSLRIINERLYNAIIQKISKSGN